MAEPNFKNRTIWTGDNLAVLQGMDSDTVDLIYLDPPFNSNKNYAAPVGSKAAGASFKDTWTMSDAKDEWHAKLFLLRPDLYAAIDAAGHSHSKGMKAYLITMSMRLVEMERILKDTGSIYLHCDPTASHYLKMVMDCVFGKDNHLNEIIWAYNDSPGGRTSRWFPKKHDVILSYASKKGRHTFNRDAVKVPIKEASRKRYQSERTIGGRTYLGGDVSGKTPEDTWMIPVVKQNKASLEGCGYPTQKPLALLERIVKASSNPGDMVLDPFCGCATACVAAERLGRAGSGQERQWAGIDLSPKTVDLVLDRLTKEALDTQKQKQKTFEGWEREVHVRDAFAKPLSRTDTGHGKYNGTLMPNLKNKGYKTRIKAVLYKQQDGMCIGCERTFDSRNLTIDHIRPRSKGGGDEEDNLMLLCGTCNSVKGDGPFVALVERLKEHGVRGVPKNWIDA